MYSDKELIEIIPTNMIFISYFIIIALIIILIQGIYYILSSTVY